MRICIDAGHDGEVDKGAIGQYGTYESDITLAVAKRLEDVLEERGFDTLMTRNCDDVETDSLLYRAEVANDAEADVFISLHCNGAASSAAEGMEVYTSPGETDSDGLATIICDVLRNRFPEQAMREDWSDGDADKEARFIVLTATDMPAVLVEMLFITNPEEEALANSEEWQHAMAIALADSICRFAEWLA